MDTVEPTVPVIAAVVLDVAHTVGAVAVSVAEGVVTVVTTVFSSNAIAQLGNPIPLEGIVSIPYVYTVVLAVAPAVRVIVYTPLSGITNVVCPGISDVTVAPGVAVTVIV